MIEYDKGPTKKMAKVFARHPDYTPHKECFWFDWGPIFYRGRLNGKARLLCVASDPGPTERIASRALVGDAGQRVQGFLSKLGLTQSYVCLNVFVYALFPGCLSEGKKILREPEHVQWRNKLFDKVTGPDLQAVIAFGTLAQDAVDLWAGIGNLPVVKVYHPSYRYDRKKFMKNWKAAIVQLRGIVTPDDDGDAALPNYGDEFKERDYAPIPKRDLPFGVPQWFGDNTWCRQGSPRSNNCVHRPKDDRHTLIWSAPKS